MYIKESHMGKLKTVGVREFRNNASAYLSGSEPIAVNRHGKVIGFYIPLERDEDEVRRAVAKLGSTVDKVLEESSMTEEELAHLLDM
jgi:antitoxin (DNA-binding transcriptional repressor) of toxin-antitoxin stability system